MIDATDLCFDYPGKRALHHVSFAIQPNTITALVGPNGAGKTTLLRCLAALETPTLGRITLDGIDAEQSPRDIHRVCGYLSDFFGLYNDLTVTQHLTFFALNHKMPRNKAQQRIETVLEQLDLVAYRDALVDSLSRGLRQRLAIAQTILPEPTILLLDEPAAGLDPEARYDLSTLLKSLKQAGMTIIVSSHILSELEDYCTDMMIIKDGRLVKQISVENNAAPNAPSLQNLYLELMQKD